MLIYDDEANTFTVVEPADNGNKCVVITGKNERFVYIHSFKAWKQHFKAVKGENLYIIDEKFTINNE